MSSVTTFVSKVLINNKTTYIKLQWKQNEIDLFHLEIVCDDGQGWSGKFTNDLAQKFIDKLIQNKDIYYTNVRKCLTGEGSEEFKIDLSVNDDGATAIFGWRKIFEEFSQLQGSLTLKQDNISKETFIDFLMDENKELQISKFKMGQQIEEAQTELAKCKSELEIFVNIKSSLESALYEKFVQLLNSKKQRIRLLEEQLLLK